MRKLLPIILALLGTAAGVGVGYVLRPPAEAPPAREEESAAPEQDHAVPGADHAAGGEHAAGGDAEYVKLNNQFIVPVLERGEVSALVVLSLSLEVTPGGTDIAFRQEPKLRDTFLSVLFEHSNAGGFEGTFTRSDRMLLLRDALLEAARRVMGPTARDVLILDINRQDM